METTHPYVRRRPATSDGGRGTRPLDRGDLDRVVALRRVTFQEERDGERMRAFYDDVLFGHPWGDPAHPSLGYFDPDGVLVGTLGVMPRPWLWRGRPLTAVVSHGLMVHPERRGSLAAITLLKELLATRPDLVVTETNERAAPIATALGGTVLQARSRRWLRVLRPGGLVVSLCEGAGVPSTLVRALAPPARLADALLATPRARVPSSNPADGPDPPLDGAGLARLLDEATSGSLLRPVYDAASVSWLLETLARTSRDQRLRVRGVRAGDRLVGWYVYYSRPGGIGRVLQVGATPGNRALVLDRLFADAVGEGNVAVSGKSDPGWDPYVASVRTLFRDGASTFVAFSPDSALIDALRSCDAFVSRLEGEGWLRFSF